MAKPILFSFVISIVLFSFFLTDASKERFSVDLIHRDSIKSPYYDPKLTHYERVTNRVRRSIHRISYFNPNFIMLNEDVQSDITSNLGEYLMSISIGTPPTKILAIADTGSDLIWTQCKPCPNCYKQSAPLFDPHSSSTYKDLSCLSESCQTFGQTECNEKKSCLYSTSYGDRSYSKGNLASETITLGSTDQRITIGCGHSNDGTFQENGSGIIGLGGGPFSLVSQLDSLISGKFSYCLVPIDASSSSKISFGANAVASRNGVVVSTPLVQKDPNTYYYLTLEAFSVNGKRVNFESARSTRGNMIIDSGTTLTILPSNDFSELEKVVAGAITAKPVTTDGPLSLCYNKVDLKAPVMIAHFAGADVHLSSLNTFVEAYDGVECFSFRGIDNSFGIYGNLAQINHLVAYDLRAKTVSFKPTDCTHA